VGVTTLESRGVAPDAEAIFIVFFNNKEFSAYTLV